MNFAPEKLFERNFVLRRHFPDDLGEERPEAAAASAAGVRVLVPVALRRIASVALSKIGVVLLLVGSLLLLLMLKRSLMLVVLKRSSVSAIGNRPHLTGADQVRGNSRTAYREVRQVSNNFFATIFWQQLQISRSPGPPLLPASSPAKGSRVRNVMN